MISNKTKKLKKYWPAAAFSLLFAAAFATWLVAAATPVRLYLAPGSQSIAVNGTFNVAVRLDSSTQVDYVRAYLTFPADKLAITGISATGSAFNYQHEQYYDNASGQVRLARYAHGGPVSGDVLVATITFQAKNPGTAAVNFAAGSSVYALSQGGTEQLTGTSGGSYSITGAPSTPFNPTPPPSTIPRPAPITPGPSPAPAPSPAPSVTVRPGSPNTPAPVPSPGNTIPDQPPGATPEGDEAEGVYVPVKIIVRSRAGSPVKDADVTVDGLTQKTDASGEVRFELMHGTTIAHISSGKVAKEFGLNVAEPTETTAGGQPEEQSFTFVLPLDNPFLKAVVGGAILIPLAAMTLFIVLRHRRAQMHPAAAHILSRETKENKRKAKQISAPPKTSAPHTVGGNVAPDPTTIKPHQDTASHSEPAPKAAVHLTHGQPAAKPHVQTPMLPPKSAPAEVPKPPKAMPAAQAKPAIHAAPAAAPPLSPPPISIPAAPKPVKTVKHTQPIEAADPAHHVPAWQAEVQRQMAQKNPPKEEYVEPKDMFEDAEDRYDYSAKLKTASVPPAPVHSPSPVAADLPKQSEVNAEHRRAPEWQEEIKQKLAKPAKTDDFEEPKDMFEEAEERMNNKNPKNPPQPPVS